LIFHVRSRAIVDMFEIYSSPKGTREYKFRIYRIGHSSP